ncbi:hypothetical protein K0M31_000002 [Melipona bicolor]|uniref:Uncharacterized protein n=1 Tax=Melipona bicolor TaxID=60889 RepID=A0AA40GCV2_9HYME|nr:hypothetical protein K0M31_000002 [Melipona bicolor]
MAAGERVFLGRRSAIREKYLSSSSSSMVDFTIEERSGKRSSGQALFSLYRYNNIPKLHQNRRHRGIWYAVCGGMLPFAVDSYTCPAESARRTNARRGGRGGQAKLDGAPMKGIISPKYGCLQTAKHTATRVRKVRPGTCPLVDSRHALLSPPEPEVHSAAHPPGLSVPAHALSSQQQPAAISAHSI